MRIALCQINPTIGRFRENTEKIIDYTRMAEERGAQLVLFPELAICGYPPQDLLERPRFIQEAGNALRTLLPHSKKTALIMGFPRENPAPTGKRVFNSAAFLHKGRILFTQDKTLLPTYDVFDESRYFEKTKRSSIFRFGGFRFGITICEDIWNDDHAISKQLYVENPIRLLKKKGAEIILNISASPFSHDKTRFRRNMIQTISRSYHIPVFYNNTVGANDSIIFDGGSFVTNSRGEIINQAAFFEEGILITDLVRERNRSKAVSLAVPEAPPTLDLPSETEMIWRALVLGIQDYFKKCGFTQAIIGLSGGVDSALVTVLAAEALGVNQILGILMPSPYSSEGSLTDAEKLARNLGIRHETIRIDSTFQCYKEALQELFSGLPEDVTEENIQARIRGNLLMAASNKFGALVLSTGNKSEIAMGYCTLYGDMSGGLAAIGDLYKTRVYDLCRYYNQRERQEVVPRSILDKAPSAELRPNQKDEDSLPPYSILDPILIKIIENRRSLPELEREFVPKGVDSETLHCIFERYARSEYKRLQAPPILKITQKAFGIGRRFPIAAKTDY